MKNIKKFNNFISENLSSVITEDEKKWLKKWLDVCNQHWGFEPNDYKNMESIFSKLDINYKKNELFSSSVYGGSLTEKEKNWLKTWINACNQYFGFEPNDHENMESIFSKLDIILENNK